MYVLGEQGGWVAERNEVRRNGELGDEMISESEDIIGADGDGNRRKGREEAVGIRGKITYSLHI